MGFLAKILGKNKHEHEPINQLPVHRDDIDLIKEVDVKWWNSLTPSAVKTIDKQVNVQYLVFIQTLVEQQGMSNDEAMQAMKGALPFYYGKLIDRDSDKFGLAGEDSKLPFILRGRVYKAISAGMLDKYMNMSGITMNAAVRRLIRERKI